MDIFIYGTGGHAKVIYDILSSNTGYKVAFFVDDLSGKEEFLSLPVLKTPEAIKVTKTGIVAIGTNHTREKVVREIKAINANINFISAIHAGAVVSPQAVVENGSAVMAGAVVNPGAVVSQHSVINTGAIVEHDCKLGAYSTLAPGVTLGGAVEVGERSFIAIGTQVKHSVKIGDDTVIGMGSVVTRDIGSLKVAYGSPCKQVKTRTFDQKYL